MRRFVILGHEVPLDGFPLNDLPGAGGRVDVLARCVTAAFLRSHGIRESVAVHLVLGEVTVRFDGHDLRQLHPDERSTAALLRTALDAKEGAIGHQEAEAAPGVHVGRFGLETVLDRIDGPLVQLHEDGTPLIDASVPEPEPGPTFVLSDHRDFSDREADRLAERSEDRVRVGPERLHADHVVTVVHNWLDTDGYTSY
jgi:tRNA (pseudouridine54-N1)-methyltransferase